MEILILLQPHKLKINALWDHVEAFDLYSRHRVAFACGALPSQAWLEGGVDYAGYDVLLIPHHCRVCMGERSFHPEVDRAIRDFDGYKVLIIQDEYDRTEIARQWILDHGIDHVFTAVPPGQIERVYDPRRFAGVEFTNVLTGYVPSNLERGRSWRPLAQRPCHIVYRCRERGSWRGELCHQKLEIAKVVKSRAEERGIPTDIEWAEDRLVFGPAWHEFLQRGRATLGSPSGSNVFDLDGSITAAVDAALTENPDLGYENLEGHFFQDGNLGVRMNQISPKFFEFIASGTALILIEDDYSGILEPEKHYLPLRKDYSNLDKIFDALEDLPRIEEMTQRTYHDIIASGRYSYRAAIAEFDDLLAARVRPRRGGSKPPAAPAGRARDIQPTLMPPRSHTSYLQAQLSSDIHAFETRFLRPLQEMSEDYAGMIQRRRAKIEKLSRKSAHEQR